MRRITSLHIGKNQASSERGKGQRRMSPLERNKKANGVCACSEKTPRRTWIARPDADFARPIASDRFER